jgi:hypothetical protein
LYIACLQTLKRYESAQTNGQLLQQVAAGPVRVELESLTREVERCSYGKQPATRADYEAARTLADRILSASAPQVQP